MKIKSALLGELELDEKEIIHFPGGIPAFEEQREFILLATGEATPFYYLQAVQNPHLCLAVAQPFTFFADYSIDIADEKLKILDFQGQAEDLLIYVVLTIPEDYQKSTANLMAPIVVNQASHKGLQFIATNSPYKTRHYLFPGQSEVAAGLQEG